MVIGLSALAGIQRDSHHTHDWHTRRNAQKELAKRLVIGLSALAGIQREFPEDGR